MNEHYKRTKAWREVNRWFRPLEYARRRCTDKKHREYDRYGGRGIICDLTANQAKMLYEMGKGHLLTKPSLDRIDPDGNYTFTNCQYIELTENVARRRPNGALSKMEEPAAAEKIVWEE